MSAPVLRPLSIGELLDKTFSLYRAHFKLFVGIMAVPGVFLFLLATVGVLTPPSQKAPSNTAAFVIATVSIGAIFVLAYGVMYAMALGATVYAVSEYYLGRETTIRRAFAQVRPFAWRTLWILMVLILTMGLGLVVFVIPGILVALRFAVVIPAAVIEDLKTSAAFRRSGSLTRGRRGAIFLLFLLFFVLNYVATFLFQMPAALLLGLWPGNVSLILKNVATLASDALAGPLLTIGLSLMYFDLRVRKEGFDLQVMMSSLGATPEPPLNASATGGIS